MAYVLAGGRGTRLMELTDRRAKPAVYFGGKSRIIDFALSNAINSGIRRISVATQYQAHSLIRHLSRGWNFLRTERNESFDVLRRASACPRRNERGTADAVYQNNGHHRGLRRALHRHPGRRPHLQDGLRDHAAPACRHRRRRDHRLPGSAAHGGHRLRRDACGRRDRVVDFVEKPKDPPGIPDRPDMALASMGIYVFETRFLMEQLRRDAATQGSNRDFGKDIIPYIVKNGTAWAHRFPRSCVRSSNETVSYWRDVGTVDAY